MGTVIVVFLGNVLASFRFVLDVLLIRAFGLCRVLLFWDHLHFFMLFRFLR
jgi:hypothetical protein